MIATLLKKPQGYMCSNCRLIQRTIAPTCSFCNYSFSNFEEIVLEQYKEIENYDGSKNNGNNLCR